MKKPPKNSSTVVLSIYFGINFYVFNGNQSFNDKKIHGQWINLLLKITLRWTYNFMDQINNETDEKLVFNKYYRYKSKHSITFTLQWKNKLKPHADWLTCIKRFKNMYENYGWVNHCS